MLANFFINISNCDIFLPTKCSEESLLNSYALFNLFISPLLLSFKVSVLVIVAASAWNISLSSSHFSPLSLHKHRAKCLLYVKKKNLNLVLSPTFGVKACEESLPEVLNFLFFFVRKFAKKAYDNIQKK